MDMNNDKDYKQIIEKYIKDEEDKKYKEIFEKMSKDIHVIKVDIELFFTMNIIGAIIIFFLCVVGVF